MESVIAPGSEGSFGVLAGHTPFIAALKKGVLKLNRNTANEFFTIGSGILEVSDSGDALVLADSALKATSADEARSKSTN